MADDPAEPPKSPPAPQPPGDVDTNQQVLQNPLDDRRRRFAEMVSGAVEPPLPLRAEAGFSDGKVRIVELVTAENAPPISLEPVNLEVEKPELGNSDAYRERTARPDRHRQGRASEFSNPSACRDDISRSAR